MEIKKEGQVFTPKWIVKTILDEVGYTSKEATKKKILEPSAGNGIFIYEIIDRIIKYNNDLSNKEILKIIENNIYLFEKDKELFYESYKNIIKYIEDKLDLKSNKLKFYLTDSLKFYKNFSNFFEFIIGNPPYVRIHNLNKDYRRLLKNNFKFTNKGNIDLYVSFFEISLYMLKKKGKIAFITPNSYFKNFSYKDFRKFLINNNLINTIIDFKSYKVFNVDTYTAITILEKNKKNTNIIYKEYIKNKIELKNIIKNQDLNYQNFIFLSSKEKEFLLNLNKKKYKLKDFCNIQYGLATLKDKVFISSIKDIKDDNLVLFNNNKIEKKILKKIIKGNKQELKQYIIFPYYKDKNNKIKSYTEIELKNKYPYTYAYFLKYKEELLNRSIEKNKQWFEYGRSQGLNKILEPKLVINNIVNNNINIKLLGKDILVYSGIFITSKNNVSLGKIKKILTSNDFIEYVKIYSKNLGNNYKTFNSKIIKNYPINDCELNKGLL